MRLVRLRPLAALGAVASAAALTATAATAAVPGEPLATVSPAAVEIRALLAGGSVVEARARVETLLAAAPADPGLLVLAGDVARAGDDRAAAADHYGRAFELAGKVAADRRAPLVFVHAANGLARLRIEDADAAGAEKVLAFAYLHYPSDRDTLTNLGLAAAMRRQWDRAARFLVRAGAERGDLLAAELGREVARLRASDPSGESAAIASLASAPPPAVPASPTRIAVEPFGSDGSSGHRAGWGVVVAALLRQLLEAARLTAPAAGASAGVAPELLVTGNVADLDAGLVVTARVLRLPGRDGVAEFTIRVADPTTLRAALSEQLTKLGARLR